jgi:hypothetical protein
MPDPFFVGASGYLVDDGARSSPPQWKWIALMKFCLLRKPLAVYFTHWILDQP